MHIPTTLKIPRRQALALATQVKEYLPAALTMFRDPDAPPPNIPKIIGQIANVEDAIRCGASSFTIEITDEA